MGYDTDYHALLDAAVSITTSNSEKVARSVREAAATFLTAEFKEHANGWNAAHDRDDDPASDDAGDDEPEDTDA